MTAAPPIDVVCVGETMAQLVPSDGLPASSAHTFELLTAGAESNVALGLAQLGDAVAWAGLVGDDAPGARVLRDVAAGGVDLSLTRKVPGCRTGLFLKDPAADGSTVTYYRDSSAASRLGPSDIDRVLAARPRHLHLSGITPALSLSCHDAVVHALTRARALGIATSFDVNHRPALWPSRADAARTLRRLTALADVVLVGLDEAGALWDTASEDEVRDSLPEPPVLVVKDGPNAATAFTPEGRFSEPALPVRVVEPVGAGDAFAAGWIHGWLRGLPQPARLRLGHMMARAALTSLADHFSIGVSPAELVATACRAGWPVPGPDERTVR
jgi:2-dehydro-3-deoxygluconokinase